MRVHAATVLVAHGDQLGEGPVWDDRHGVLYRVDAVKGAVLALHVASGAERRFDVGRHVGSVVTCDDGDGLLVAAQGGFHTLDTGTGRTSLLAPVAPDDADLLMNDGACDPAGRFVAGTMHRSAAPGRGALLRYAPPAGAVPLVRSVGISNGLAWDATGATLFYIDSLLGRVDRLDYDLQDGAVTAREPAFDLRAYSGMPDGMTIDADGCLWIAFWRGGAVRRFDGEGRLLDEVRLPVSRTTSCCLGGDDLRDLYITTARRSIRDDADAARAEPLAGAVFRCRVEVPGVPTHRWRAAG